MRTMAGLGFPLLALAALYAVVTSLPAHDISWGGAGLDVVLRGRHLKMRE